MIASNSPTYRSNDLFVIVVSDITTGSTSTYDNYTYSTRPSHYRMPGVIVLDSSHQQPTIGRSVASSISRFSQSLRGWLAMAAERARARCILRQSELYARRLEREPAPPPRLPRGRVPSGASRYRVMFY